MPSQYDYDLIRDYLHGLIDRNSAGEIAELIAKDETARSIAEGILFLEKNFSDENEINSYLESFRRAQLKTVHREAADRKKMRRRWLKIAAAFLLLALAGFIFRQKTTQPDLTALVDAELARPYGVSNIVRSHGESTPFEIALGHYASRNYPDALHYFSLASARTDDLATLTFYEALSHLYSKNYQDAIRLFQSTVVVESRYVQQARWHLALAAIKAKDHGLALTALGPVVDNDRHYKHDAAVKIYEQLN